MAKKPAVPEPTPQSDVSVTRETLDQTPARALAFLSATGRVPAIHRGLSARGYTHEEHLLGWRLLHAASGFDPGAPVEELDAEVTSAIATLDAWDEDGFRIVRAGLTRRHSEQAKFVLDGIDPSTGPAAVVGVRKLLDRLDALESGEDRKATRKADHAALATLAERGIDAKERARLRALVNAAESTPADLPLSEEARAAREEDHVAALKALRVWYEDWSEMARAVIKRRDYLIRLGLAKRKPPKKKTSTVAAPQGSDATAKDSGTNA